MWKKTYSTKWHKVTRGYYKDCVPEEDPMPCDNELLLHICNELEVLRLLNFMDQGCGKVLFWQIASVVISSAIPTFILFVQTMLKSHSRCTRAINTRSSSTCTTRCRGHPMQITRTSSIFHSTISREDQVKNLPSFWKKSTVLSWIKVSVPVGCIFSFGEDIFIELQ